MAEAASASHRFQMVGSRASMREGPVPDIIEQQIQALEDSIERVPDFAFDLAKTLIETICKTILEDIGRPADPNWDAPRIMRETTSYLSLLPRNHPDPSKTRGSITKTLNGLHTTVQGLCELRNNYGIASHGRDGFSARLELRQATLAAHAADTVVSFLYRIHRDTLTQTPGSRVYYDDHGDFNEAFDSENGVIRLAGVELLPSRVLFHTDPEAYKAALNDHIAERGEGNNGAPAAAEGEAHEDTE